MYNMHYLESTRWRGSHVTADKSEAVADLVSIGFLNTQ